MGENSIDGGSDAKRAFYLQQKSIWRVDEADVNPAGYAKGLGRSGRRFCNVVVRNAGHEATSYAPRAMYDFNERFMHRNAFDGKARTVGPVLPQCAQCGGAPPLAGTALPECVNPPLLNDIIVVS